MFLYLLDHKIHRGPLLGLAILLCRSLFMELVRNKWLSFWIRMAWQNHFLSLKDLFLCFMKIPKFYEISPDHERWPSGFIHFIMPLLPLTSKGLAAHLYGSHWVHHSSLLTSWCLYCHPEGNQLVRHARMKTAMHMLHIYRCSFQCPCPSQVISAVDDWPTIWINRILSHWYQSPQV